ncbi:2,3-bisphosphoglycerate-dependent phosphoglycerate mutase [Paraburkholderia fungorum]|uniref:2,3-bisphosphoglycerate-dependent phosphoglycerate mutase n=1 Tax=Paraburkholderia fungorum TaxID=134537 RepID=UPI001C1EAE46|nr:2,3-diphosphoglycerate-dependent phosphoglycerate mutase [Paraburkholderia fungorum]MBU7435818.1 2,3-diphosphoglycerate-dependent phosphoglycerate mutase [Paraburkholderia fungorum]
MMMGYLVVARHGESSANHDDRFAGWDDVPLTNKGIEQARMLGSALINGDAYFDAAYSSVLQRAVDTLSIIRQQVPANKMVIRQDWRLNERHYGALTGKSKSQVRDEFGAEQTMAWRRGFESRPPPIDEASDLALRSDPRYSIIDESEWPRAESLSDTYIRVRSLWNREISQLIKRGKNVLIVAHGNSIRVLIAYLEQWDLDSLSRIDVENGRPILYRFDATFKAVRQDM